MQKPLATNLTLFFILLLLIGFISFYDNDDTNPTLTKINKSTINNIIIHKEKQNIVLAKTDGIWKMTEPYAVLAHQFRIKTLLSLLEAPISSQYDISEVDLKIYGLQKPRAHIQFDQTHIYFGKSNPVNTMRYLQVKNKMALLHDELYPLIRSQPTSFVDLALLPQQSRIKNLKLPDMQFTQSNNHWETLPNNIASADQIQSLIQNWQYAKAFAVHAYIKRKALGNIVIELENKKIITYQITDIKPWLILARTDLNIEYHLDASQQPKLLALSKP